ncbi:MAG: hypothetical protein MRQ09_06880, partial [Candidatus Midichloria sp.]|nr:hypothetical protein [Candidatus Midichloria sp.]
KLAEGVVPWISKDEQEIIKEWIFQDGNLTIKAVKLRIEEKFRKNIGITATHKLMKSLGFLIYHAALLSL